MILFTIEGQPKLEKIVAKVPAAFNMTAVLDEGAAILYNRMRTRFVQQIDPMGVPWVPSFASIREHRNTLFKTGKLFRSLQLYSTGPNSRAIGSNVTNQTGFPYGLALQFGWGKLPPRIFLGFSQTEDVPFMLNLVALRVGESFK
jgi:hypothetical protein